MPDASFEISLEGIKISAVPLSLVVPTQPVEQVVERFGDEIRAQPYHGCHLAELQPPLIFHVAAATALAVLVLA